jgi:hypothetical protein
MPTTVFGRSFASTGTAGATNAWKPKSPQTNGPTRIGMRSSERSSNVITLTTDDLLWPCFLKDRSRQKILLKTGAQVVCELVDELYPGVRIGMVYTVHTYGRDLGFKPHVHLVMTKGSLKDGEWVKIDSINCRCGRFSRLGVRWQGLCVCGRIVTQQAVGYTAETVPPLEGDDVHARQPKPVFRTYPAVMDAETRFGSFAQARFAQIRSWGCPRRQRVGASVPHNRVRNVR